MSQTISDFINSYKDFDYENGELVVWERDTGKYGILKVVESFGKKTLAPHRAYSRSAKGAMDIATKSILSDADIPLQPIWNWVHTEQTLFIIL